MGSQAGISQRHMFLLKLKLQGPDTTIFIVWN